MPELIITAQIKKLNMKNAEGMFHQHLGRQVRYHMRLL